MAGNITYTSDSTALKSSDLMHETGSSFHIEILNINFSSLIKCSECVIQWNNTSWKGCVTQQQRAKQTRNSCHQIPLWPASAAAASNAQCSRHPTYKHWYIPSSFSRLSFHIQHVTKTWTSPKKQYCLYVESAKKKKKGDKGTYLQNRLTDIKDKFIVPEWED